MWSLAAALDSRRPIVSCSWISKGWRTASSGSSLYASLRRSSDGRGCAGTQLDQERLRLFEPDAERRRQVLHAVAEDLRWDEPDMAGLLFALCGNHGKALEEGNTTMSSRIRALLDATSPEQERSLVADVQALALRANDLRTRCGVHRMCPQFLHAALSSSMAWYERSLMWALFTDH